MTTVGVVMMPAESAISPVEVQPTMVQFDAPQPIYPPQPFPPTPFTTGAVVPQSVLISPEADASANGKRVPCLVLHVFTLFFSLLLFGVSGIVMLLTIPLALASLVTSIFAIYHLSSLTDMSVGCCCTPLKAYSWIFGMNVVQLVLAVPTTGACLWRNFSAGDTAGFYAVLMFVGALVSFVTIIFSIVAMILLSGLQQICRDGLRLPPHFRTVLP
jgi:hypothetical protein